MKMPIQMRKFSLRFLAPCTAAAALLSPHAVAGPKDGELLVGIGDISFDGVDTWTITASNGAVFQFSSFDIAALETVIFDQPGSNAAVLNLIPFGGASQIDGSLFANGIVFFVNPSGMVFGADAVVDVGGLYAAAANIGTDAKEIQAFGDAWSTAWLAGDPIDFDLSGTITVEAGANLIGETGIHLLGRHVQNFGHIEVGNGGIISMIASDGTITLGKPGDHYVVQFTDNVLPGQGEPGSINGIGVHNAGTLIAGDDGTIILGASDVYALAIKLEGDGIAGTNVAVHGDVGLVIAPNGGAAGEEGKDEEEDNTVAITAENITFHGSVDAVDLHPFGFLIPSGAGLEILKLDGAGGNVAFEGAVGEIGSLASLTVEGQTVIGGGLISTTGDQIYEESVTLSADATLEGQALVLMDGLDGDGNALTLTFGDQVEVSDAIFTNIGDFASTGEGGTLLGDFTTSGSQTYANAVTLNDDVVTLSGTTITFDIGSSVDAQEEMEQELVIDGDAVFSGNVGETEALQSLSVSGTTLINGVLIRTVDSQDYTGLVTLGPGTTTLESQSLTLGDGLEGDGNSLTLTIGDQIEVSNETLANLHNFTSDGEGGTLLGTFTTTGAQTYNNVVTLDGDIDGNVNLEGSAVSFGDTVDGNVNLSILATEGDVEFHGAVGSMDALTMLEITLASLMDDPQAGSVILFDTDTVIADEIVLNDFTIGHTPFATIAGTGNLTFTTSSFTMGQGQKMSVLGTLNIDAPGGDAILSDINTLGDLIVTADNIVLLLRPAGGDDTGLDFVAGGDFVFSSAPVLMGEGQNPLFASPSGTPPANLDGFLFLIFDPSPGMFTGAEGRFLDLRATGATLDDISTALNAMLPDPEALDEVLEDPDADPILREALRDIIAVRPLEDWELVALAQGRGVYEDSDPSEVEPDTAERKPAAIAVRRLRPEEARALLIQYWRLETQQEKLVDLMSRGWDAYQQDVGDAAIPLRFVMYLRDLRLGDRFDRETFTSEDAGETMRGLVAISDYIRQLQAAGASPAEARAHALETVFEKYRPAQLTPQQFAEVVRGARALQTGELYTRPVQPLRR